MKPFSLVNPGSWRRMGDAGELIDEGYDALMGWEYNPWRKIRTGESLDLGGHLGSLRQSDRPEDKAEVERLEKLGREWYERILARYPDLAQAGDKEVPLKENGFQQWSELVKRLREEKKDSLFEKPFSREMEDSFRKQTPQDPAEVREWVSENRARIDEIRAIGLLPGQSAQGIGDDERNYGFDSQGIQALVMDAQTAVADGDLDRSMESIRAANGLADHHSKIGTPTVYDTLIAAHMRSQTQNHVLSTILPALPSGQTDVAAWEALLDLKLQQPADFARTLRSEWNVRMPARLLPAMSDTRDPANPPDADHLAETYTRHMQETAKQADGMSLADYAASPKVMVPVDHLSRKAHGEAMSLGIGPAYDIRSRFVGDQELTGLTQAAFAIMKGRPVPLDPVYGLPYKWDPEKRTLALPDLPGGRKFRQKPLTVPRM
ncbi:MAG: hypothetical protein EOP87_10620 [Verrucomicrobiaceae bacterium]|nr:MAG: hypothetical protein EOP87_10620 [Verrucomicrobiaceae bacterium]